jgi:hypothetical protein
LYTLLWILFRYTNQKKKLDDGLGKKINRVGFIDDNAKFRQRQDTAPYDRIKKDFSVVAAGGYFFFFFKKKKK